MRVVLDTNVLVSALLFGGELGKVADHLAADEFVVCFTETTLLELRAVLRYPKFAKLFPKAKSRDELVSKILVSAITLPEIDIESVVHGDPTDDKFFACALVSSADYIVSGDKKVLAIGAYGVTKVVSPKQFLTIISKYKKKS